MTYDSSYHSQGSSAAFHHRAIEEDSDADTIPHGATVEQ